MLSPIRPAFRHQQKLEQPVDTLDRHEFGVQKCRKYSSTGGGRAWTEDEEAYLLQTRSQKMPYKHIAAHLKKTELACRLHYHQLSHGTNRRKRAASFSSISSMVSPTSPHHRLSPEPEPSTAPTTPEHSGDRFEAEGGWRALHDLPEGSVAASPVSHPQPILPKPVPTLPYPVARPQPPPPTQQQQHRHHDHHDHHHRPSPPPHAGLRLDCDVAAARERYQQQPAIDRARLCEIYESHRLSFWKMIAADYGEGADPARLEDVWKKGLLATPQQQQQQQLPPRASSPDERASFSAFGRLSEGRVVLPALQPPLYDRSASCCSSSSGGGSSSGRVGGQRFPSFSAESPLSRFSGKLPTPSTATTESSLMSAGSHPSTAIAALLNGSGAPARCEPLARPYDTATINELSRFKMGPASLMI